MKRLSTRRLEKVLAFLRETYQAQDLDEFARVVPSAITQVIEADLATYSEVNPGRKRIGWHHQPGDMPLLKFRSIFEQFMHGDPLVTWYANGADGSAVKISDLLTRRQFRSLPIYQEFYRHLGLEHQIAFLLDTLEPLLVGVTLNRSARDFTEEDRLTLNLLRPHLIQAYRNAGSVTLSRRDIALITQGIEDTGRGIVLLSREGAIRRATPRACRWLAVYCGWPGRGSSRRLPDAIERWLREEMRKRSDTDSVDHPSVPFFIGNDEGTLTVRMLVQDDQALLLLDERPRIAAHDPSFMRGLQAIGLSPRESQVMSWVAEGKTNPEIAVILGMSTRTVQTHLEHIYRKLDVDTRAAATAKAIEARAMAVDRA